MAKRNRNNIVTASFHYLVKSVVNEQNPAERDEQGFSEQEFERITQRIANTDPLDDTDDEVIAAIKSGQDLPFLFHEEAEQGLHFGDFEGAYYGQKYRNNRLGEIDADSLNLRRFHYLVTRLRDGRILIGTTYHGQYGDYDGIQSCFSHLLHGNYRVTSKTLKSVSSEIGDGQPISLKLTVRKNADRPERKPLFGSSGEFAIKNTDFGDDFQERVVEAAGRIRGSVQERKRAIAEIVNQGNLLEIDENEIVGCSAVIKQDGRTRTVYFLGENNFATKFFLRVLMDRDGAVDRERVKSEMIRVMRENIVPLL